MDAGASMSPSLDSLQRHWAPVSPVWAGLRGVCLRCGEGRLFDGFLKIAPRCDVCALDYSFADPADGPAFFVLCFGCLPAVFFALWLEVEYQPPFWIHLVTSLPFLLVTCILPLRPLKGWLIDSQYYYDAEVGRLDKSEAPSAETSGETHRSPDETLSV